MVIISGRQSLVVLFGASFVSGAQLANDFGSVSGLSSLPSLQGVHTGFARYLCGVRVKCSQGEFVEIVVLLLRQLLFGNG